MTDGDGAGERAGDGDGDGAAPDGDPADAGTTGGAGTDRTGGPDSDPADRGDTDRTGGPDSDPADRGDTDRAEGGDAGTGGSAGTGEDTDGADAGTGRSTGTAGDTDGDGAGTGGSTAAVPDPVVSADWVADRLDDPGVRVVDVREPWEYEGIGHLPGAVNVPFEEFRAPEAGAAEAGMLPGADRFAALLGEAGVGDGATVVAYDDTHGVFAARFVVTALLYGAEDVYLLDGDYSAWSREHPVSRDPVDLAPAERTPGRLRRELLIDRAAVRAAIDDPGAVLVDTREGWEFAEGHLPGAVNLDWRALVDGDTRGILPDERARAVLADRGIEPDRRVVLYCNTARRISHTYLVLRHLGFPEVAFYEGSLTEWEAADEPLETGGEDGTDGDGDRPGGAED